MEFYEQQFHVNGCLLHCLTPLQQWAYAHTATNLLVSLKNREFLEQLSDYCRLRLTLLHGDRSRLRYCAVQMSGDCYLHTRRRENMKSDP
jgi:hypothetical protein